MLARPLTPYLCAAATVPAPNPPSVPSSPAHLCVVRFGGFQDRPRNSLKIFALMLPNSLSKFLCTFGFRASGA